MIKKAIITVTILSLFFLFSCNNNSTKTTIDKEKELLEKELELSKKESEVQNKTESKLEKQEQVKKTEAVSTNIHDDPVKIMQTIFTAAKTSDFSKLYGLCDPTGDNDGDTKSICSIGSQSFSAQKEFIEYFQNGKVVGTATIIDNNASVKFKFGPDGNIDEEMDFVKVGGKWYLSSF